MGTMERILRLMAANKASDVYLSANAPALIKIQGECIPLNNQTLTPDAPLTLLAEIVEPARIEELEDVGELNMGVPLEGIGRFRVSAMRQRGSYAVVIRYVPQDIPTLEDLDLPDTFRDLIMAKRGLILFVGATGSGKSTSLASMIDYRNGKQTGHILTVEDPIEYQFTNKRSIINQREIGSDTNSLQVALKNALRQAPDVIMIGEIRDRETMSAAIAYAQSGHLCPTLLGDLGSALRAVISQRLVKTVAGKRAAAIEIMLNTKLVGEMIEQANFSGVREAMEKSMADGSTTFEAQLAEMITSGKISREEGLANSDSPTNLLWRLQNDFQMASNAAKAQAAAAAEPDDVASFTEIVLDVNQE